MANISTNKIILRTPCILPFLYIFLIVMNYYILIYYIIIYYTIIDSSLRETLNSTPSRILLMKCIELIANYELMRRTKWLSFNIYLSWEIIMIGVSVNAYLSLILLLTGLVIYFGHWYTSHAVCLWKEYPGETHLSWFFIQNFPFPRPVEIPRLKSQPALLFDNSYRKNNLIYTFPKGTSVMWNANNLVQGLNSDSWVYYLQQLTLRLIDKTFLTKYFEYCKFYSVRFIKYLFLWWENI